MYGNGERRDHTRSINMPWFPGYLVLRYAPALVRTGERFSVADPWNGGQQTQFVIEVYKMAPKGWDSATVNRNMKLLGDDLCNIRSSADGKSRRLPESLVELWHTKRVATEALPHLLHRLQPSLRRSDYSPILHHRRFEWAGIIVALVCLGIMIFCRTVIPDDGTGARAIGTFGFGFAAFASLILFAALARHRRSRPRDQMQWILANLSPSAYHPQNTREPEATSLQQTQASSDDSTRLIAECEKLMAEWLRDNGCPCRFPRFRATVERETDIFGASMGTWEQQHLMMLFDRKLKLVEIKRVAGKREGRCPRCGAAIRRWEAEPRRDQIMDHMRVVPNLGIADIGAPLDGQLPRCFSFFGVADAKTLRDADLQYPRLSLDAWIAWMKVRQPTN